MNPAIGIYGGTFDPIHEGHLQVALRIQKICHLNQIRFIPCQQPLLKKKVFAAATDRVAMLDLVLEPYSSSFQIDLREINRCTPSYTLYTLESLREEFPKTPLCLILGWDAWLSMPHWYQWQKLIELAHFIIIHRPQSNHIPLFDKKDILHSLPLPLQNWWQEKNIDDPCYLSKSLAGCIYFYAELSIPISSTLIRQSISLGKDNVIKKYLSPAVWAYIESHKLYKSDS